MHEMLMVGSAPDVALFLLASASPRLSRPHTWMLRPRIQNRNDKLRDVGGADVSQKASIVAGDTGRHRHRIFRTVLGIAPTSMPTAK